MRFEGDISWDEMKTIFKQIGEAENIEHRGTRIIARELVDLDLKNLHAPNDMNRVYKWMKRLEGQNKKPSNVNISLRRFIDYGECSWNLCMSTDESFYEVSCELRNEPGKCKYNHNSCGKVCKILYRGFVEGKFDYEDIIAGPRGPKDKGSRYSKGA